jgi:ethanolamine utilization protein EutQ
MPEAKLFKRSEMTFAAYGGPPGKATIARLVGPDISKTMGAGIATFDGCSIEWTVLYDEVIVVLEGRFRLRLGKDFGQVMEAGPGDLIWLPEGTPLKYEGDRAVVCYVLDPVDWRRRHGIA